MIFLLGLSACGCGNPEKLVASESGGDGDDLDAAAGASSSADDFGDGPAATPPTPDPPRVSSAPGQPADNDAPVDNGDVWPVPSPKVKFQWMNADADSETAVDGHTLLGNVQNLTDEVRFLELRVQADCGTNQVLALPPTAMELAGGEALDVEVSLDDFGFDFAEQLYSGAVSLRIFAFDAQGSAHYQVEYGPMLYFHADGSGLVVYGEELLRTSYNAGDFAGLKDVEPAPDTTITRIVQGTHVSYNDFVPSEEAAAGDDAAPPTVEEVIP